MNGTVDDVDAFLSRAPSSSTLTREYPRTGYRPVEIRNGVKVMGTRRPGALHVPDPVHAHAPM